MNNDRLQRRSQRGFSLAEVLIASAIFVVIMVAALLLYDRGNKVFQQGNDSTDMQQNVRVAYDRMLSDVRMAGFDYLRAGRITTTQQVPAWAPSRAYTAGTLVIPTTANGHVYRATTSATSSAAEPSWSTTTGGNTSDGASLVWQENGGMVSQQPDEQIEYAGTTAITVRGNFDYSANVAGDGDHGRETNLETSNFPIVTTGNDEIVTYALVSSDSTKNTGTVSFYADINNGACSPSTTPCRNAFPGGAAERQVSITGVDLTNNNPPYTLYRFTFDTAGAVVRTPLADNIRSLNFIYYSDTSGTQLLRDSAGALAPNVGGAGQYNPATPAAVIPERLTRGRIRAIRVRLVGMTSTKDANFQDTDTIAGIIDTASTSTTGTFPMVTDTIAKNYRKMALDTMIVPRNLGLAGIAQSYYDPPVAPTVTSVCYGYCGIAVVNWTPNTNTPNANYAVLWDTSATGDFSNAVDAGTANSFAVDLTQQNLATTYYFKVRAYNDAGSAVSTNSISATIANATQPGQVLSATATNGTTAVAGKVHLTWTAPSTVNSGAISCNPSGTAGAASFIREIRGYRIYRGTTSTFTTTSGATLVADENTTGATAPVGDTYGNYSWDDTTVASCGTYYYRIAAVEWCEPSTTYNSTGNRATSIGVENPLNSAAGLKGTTPDTTPATPTNFAIDTTTSACDVPSNLCHVTINWSKVTQDTTGNALTIANYELERQQFLSTAPTVVVGTLTSTVPAGSTSTVTYNDAAVPEHDPATSIKYSYKYRVRAVQTSPCSASLWTTQIVYPPPCSFSGSVVVETGASSGDGLTAGTAWVMNAGDTFSVTAPVGNPFAKVTMDISAGGTPISSATSLTNPANFSWSDQTSGVVYTAVFTMTNSAGCVQQLTRYVQQEAPVGCTLRTNDNGTIISQVAGTFVLNVDLVNSTGEALQLQSIDFTWTQPSKIVWNDVKFPSGGVVNVLTASSASGSSPFTVTLSPKPSTLSTSDVIVPANGQIRINLDMAKTNGNPSLTTSAITSICVKYTRASVTGKTFICRIYPSAGAGNPFTSCN
jgi:prepilin-type N-terminal cleavage/methylation domain-containing protein